MTPFIYNLELFHHFTPYLSQFGSHHLLILENFTHHLLIYYIKKGVFALKDSYYILTIYDFLKVQSNRHLFETDVYYRHESSLFYPRQRFPKR